MTFAKWTRPHFADDAETWSESELAPTLNGWEQREGGESTPPVLITEPMAFSENQRAEVLLTDYARQLTSGGGKPGQGYPAVLTLSMEGSPARTSAWPASGPVFPVNAAVSGMSSTGCCENCGHSGVSLKMFPDYFPPTGVPISVSYSGAWMTSGTVSRGEFWTRAGSESPNGAVVCSLSAVLETRPVPRRYWLSARAAAGILRRAAKRGKQLPSALAQALVALSKGTESVTAGTLRT